MGGLVEGLPIKTQLNRADWDIQKCVDLHIICSVILYIGRCCKITVITWFCLWNETTILPVLTQVPPSLAPIDALDRYTQISSHPLHKTNKPGILSMGMHPSKVRLFIYLALLCVYIPCFAMCLSCWLNWMCDCILHTTQHFISTFTLCGNMAR